MIKLLTALLLLAPSLALAQSQNSGIRANGAFTVGHTVRCQNSTCTVVVDGGGSGGSNKNGQGYLTEIGITNTGTPFCINDALINAPGGYHQLCLGANSLGGGLISYNAVAGASPLSLNFIINGTTFAFPGAGTGNVNGPSSPVPTAQDLTIWNGGLTIADSKNIAVLHPWAFPGTVSSLTNAMEINVGSFPTASEIPAAVLQGLSVKVAVPSSFTEQPWPATAVSGYITNGNTGSANSTVVALFGFAGQTTGAGVPGTPFGLNTVVANCASVGCANGSGFANGNAVGAEFDINVKKIGATTPIGQAVGLFVTGDSEAVPSNGAYAIRVKQFGISGGVPWTAGFQTDNGAASNGIIIGAAAAAGAASSQPITWSANSGSPIFMSATLDQNQDLGFTGTPDAGGIIALNVQARNSFKVGASGAGINVLTSASGVNTSIYGDLGTPALVLQNTIAQNDYRNTTHLFQNIAGNVTIYTMDSSGLYGQSGALATNATGPFVYVNAQAGVPSGVPTDNAAGRVAVTVDTTNHKICWYEQPVGAWKCAAGT